MSIKEACDASMPRIRGTDQRPLVVKSTLRCEEHLSVAGKRILKRHDEIATKVSEIVKHYARVNFSMKCKRIRGTDRTRW